MSTDFSDEVSEFEEALTNEMWEATYTHVEEKDSSTKSPPFSIVDFISHKSMDNDNFSMQEEVQITTSIPSKPCPHT